MKLKQFALKGLVTLSVVVALCMFFSGTVKTITTPKIKVVTTKEGKLEQTAQLNAKLVFDESEPFRIEAAMEATVLVERVFVRPGYEVKKGDIIFSAAITDFEEKMDEIRTKYQEKMVAVEDLERKNSERVTKTTRTTQFKALVAAQDALHEADLALKVAMRRHGIDLDLVIPEGANELQELTAQAQGQSAPEEVLQAIESRYYARVQVEDAQKVFDETNKNWKYEVTPETWSYIMERDELLAEMSELDEQRIGLELLRHQLSEVRAPRDGYITAVSVKVGENYDGKAAAFEMSAEGVVPVLRADVSEAPLAIDAGAKVTIESGYYEIETLVSATGFDENGKKYADIEVTDELIRAKGSVYNLTLADMAAEVSMRADRVTTLIPASAVRSEGENADFVYVIEQKRGSFTGDSMYVVKTPVTVLGRSDKLVSVAEEMYGARLADKEDRAISDGAAVMEYVN